jgi:uncharacterized protein YdiU (UPF0061 family)
MNTDNLSILGLTIDYGPYGWIDNLDPDWTPNTTDAGGRRYRFGHQARIAHWNLAQLANALVPVMQDTGPLEEGLQHYVQTFLGAERAHNAAKLGLRGALAQEDTLMRDLFSLLHAAETDMTIFFRALARLDPNMPSLALFDAAFYDPAKRDAQAPLFEQWLERYAARVREEALDPAGRVRSMNATNPFYVPRNYLAQQAIDLLRPGHGQDREGQVRKRIALDKGFVDSGFQLFLRPAHRRTGGDHRAHEHRAVVADASHAVVENP